MRAQISQSNISSFQKEYQKNPQNRISRNALTRTKIQDVAMNWDAFTQINHQYSHIVKGEMGKVTDQKKSGRCWGFAGLNLFRIELSKKYNLKDFEFSQNYFIFWDKLEKSNYFFENIIKTADQPLDSRLVAWILSNPLEDGGQWDMFVNLINKYGVVPKTAMPESFQSSNTGMLNRLLTRKLREYAHYLRTQYAKGVKVSQLRKDKEEMLSTVYQVLCLFLGTPPTTFEWEIRDKKNIFKRFTNQTPTEFMKKHVDINLADKVCLIHCPMSDKNYNELYTVSHLGNVEEGDVIRYVNLEISQLKNYASKSLKDGEAVWFGCDVGKMFNLDLGVMDIDLYDYDLLLGTNLDLDKTQRLEYGDSLMTHAMLFTGVDIKDRKTNKWRVENSWGTKYGDRGYFTMSDKWFEEYMYEVVVDKKYVPKSVLKILERDPVALNPWDPMGALAK